MPTRSSVSPTRQQKGAFGEMRVVATCSCPRCKRARTLKRLPPNFKCADIICDFCGYLAQVKTSTQKDVDVLPATIPGAAWGPQHERMESGIYFPLFIVLVSSNRRRKAIYYLPSDFQTKSMFVERPPLSTKAKRAGWTGYKINLNPAGPHAPVRLMT